MLRVLIQNRPDSSENPGGDTIQMEQTASFLRRLGHQVDISLDLQPDLSSYDLVHLSNLTRPFETLLQAENARGLGKPYILNAIYWDLRTVIPSHAYVFPHSLIRRLPTSAWRWLDRLRCRYGTRPGRETCRQLNLRSVQEIQAHILRGARFIVVNSEAEKTHLADCFGGVLLARIHVVMNGVSPILGPCDLAAPRKAGTFLCAGAIGPRKNQLGLVQAFRRLPKERLLILGQSAPGHARYRKAVERAAGSNVEFHDRVLHERMCDYLKQTKALVQPSYIETPGLVAMEAAAAGLPIVVSDVEPVREYFGKLAFYCDPASPDSIVDACRLAAQHGASDGVDFADRFKWERVLSPLESVYKQLCSELGAHHGPFHSQDVEGQVIPVFAVDRVLTAEPAQ